MRRFFSFKVTSKVMQKCSPLMPRAHLDPNRTSQIFESVPKEYPLVGSFGSLSKVSWRRCVESYLRWSSLGCSWAGVASRLEMVRAFFDPSSRRQVAFLVVLVAEYVFSQFALIDRYQRCDEIGVFHLRYFESYVVRQLRCKGASYVVCAIVS